MKLSIKTVISGVIMFIVVSIIANYLPVSIWNTIIEIIVGGVVYVGMLLILKYQFIKDLINQVYVGIKDKLKVRS